MFGNRGQSNSGNNRPVCRFFLEGRCRFGDSCKNEHPAGESGKGRGADSQFSNNYSITTEQIRAELTTERPIWPLSSYAPGKNAPRGLIDADFEHSPEEMRVMHYLAQATNNLPESSQRETALANGIETKIQAILSDLDGALKYVVDGQNQHPNRIDMTKEPFGSQSNTNTGSAFGAPSQSTSAFGQPSSFGTSSNAFGRPATATQASGFGQPSALGGNSAFGKPSALGQASAFGQPSALGQGSAFGKPSALGGSSSGFGKPSFGQPSQPSAFGQPSQPGQSSAFGQPSQPSQPGQTSAFGQPSQPGQSSAFGQPSQPTAFGQAGFAKASPFGAGNAQPQSTFGQASGLGTNKPSPFAAATSNNTASPFATAAGNSSTSPFATGGNSNASPFAAAAKNNTGSAFGATANASAPSSFGKPSSPSPFGSTPAASQNQQQASSLGQPSAFGAKPSPFAASAAPTQTQSGFGATQTPPSQTTAIGGSNATSTQGVQRASDHLGRDGRGQLNTFKGQPVRYDESKKAYLTQDTRGGRVVRIWFPSGPPAPVADAQASDELYEGALGQTLAKLYLHVKDTGTFENGIVPEIPPKVDWVGFDI